jgi:hypothetical protein
VSIAGYLTRGNGELRLSKKTASEISGEFHGEVLNGERSVEEGRMKWRGGARADGEFYADLDFYDPVLRSHCRL